MNIAFLLAAALAYVQPDPALAEVGRAVELVRDQALVAMSEERIASAAARAIGSGNPDAVRTKADLLAALAAVRARDGADARKLAALAIDAMVAETGFPGGHFDVKAVTAAADRADAPDPDPAPGLVVRREGDVAILTFARFELDSGEQLAALAKQPEVAAARAVVLDLRGNSGGLLSVVVEVADQFLTEGEIAKQCGRKPLDCERWLARRGDALEERPMVVLTDGKTAAGGEIIAAALRDHERARIVGEKTLGHGAIRTLLQLSGRTGLTLTTAQSIRPGGTPIHGAGVTPDVVVPARADGTDAALIAALALAGDAR